MQDRGPEACRLKGECLVVQVIICQIEHAALHLQYVRLTMTLCEVAQKDVFRENAHLQASSLVEEAAVEDALVIASLAIVVAVETLVRALPSEEIRAVLQEREQGARGCTGQGGCRGAVRRR